MKDMEPMKPMEPMQPMAPMEPMEPLTGSGERWWPAELGTTPNSAGGQNGVRYAFFSESQRLVVDEGGGKLAVFDTGGREVSGVAQRQSGGGRHLVFTSGSEEIDLSKLRRA